MAMALLQAEILPDWIGFDHPLTWVITLILGIAFGAALGAFQGAIVAYVGVPSFIVTLGGLLAWRGVAWWFASGRTIAPMDSNFQLLGGGSRGTIGGGWSCVVGVVAAIGLVAILVNNRRQRQRYGFGLRPLWADSAIGVVGGYLVAVELLGLDAGAFWSQAVAKVDLYHDLGNGIIKSAVFGFVVVWIAVFEGYDCVPTSEGLGRATTRTVVHSSLAVLGLDFVLTALMFNE